MRTDRLWWVWGVLLIGAGIWLDRAVPTLTVVTERDCPHARPLVENLAYALRSLRQPPGGYALVYVEDLPATDVRRGYGSPTILVDGQDLFGVAPSMGQPAGCRLYPGGVPSVETIAAALGQG